jgi:hypothetical protein
MAGYPAVEVAKAALCEVGLPDLAAMVEPNRAGIPMICNDAAHKAHRSPIARAFVLGHQAIGHPATVGRGITSDFEWVDCCDCPTCAARLENMTNPTKEHHDTEPA